MWQADLEGWQLGYCCCLAAAAASPAALLLPLLMQ
jgi:hypothetical protein